VNGEIPEAREIKYIANLLKARGWSKEQIMKLLSLYGISGKEIG